MDTENEPTHESVSDKQFTREKVAAIVRNMEMATVKGIANTVINNFNAFIHSTECISKHRWDYTLTSHLGITSLILYELYNYFEHDMVSVLPTADPYTVSIHVHW